LVAVARQLPKLLEITEVIHHSALMEQPQLVVAVVVFIRQQTPPVQRVVLAVALVL
jgi:hypothetical protein